MKSTIVFDPDVDDRALDREVKKIDQSLDQAGEIKPRLDESSIGDVQLDGVVDGGGVGGGGAGGMGTAALASRLPKSIGGVTASSAMPVALAGSVGVGMLSAMHNASARMQTSSALLGQAWNNVWRPLGDKLDQLFIRDIVRDLFNETKSFEKTLRNGEWLKAFSELSLGVNLDEDSVAQKIGGAVGLFFGGPVMARMWSGLAQDMSDAVVNQIESTPWLREGMATFQSGIDTLSDTLANATPGVPDWRDITPGVPDWRDIAPGIPDWTGLSARKFIQWAVNGGRNPSGNGGGGTPPSGGGGGGTPPSTGGNEPPGRRPPGSPGTVLQRGGVVHGPTTARVAEAGPEVVQPLSEFEGLAERIARTAARAGGGGGEVDMGNVERKLDDVNRNLKRLSQAMSNTSIQVGREEFGRLATDARHDSVFDTDATL